MSHIRPKLDGDLTVIEAVLCGGAIFVFVAIVALIFKLAT